MSTPIKTTSAPHALNRRQVVTAGVLTMVSVAARPSFALAEPNAEISREEESIHQERVFKAERKRVYKALTVEAQFDRIVQLSGVMKADAMTKVRNPTKLSPHVGGAFALFGGYIVGRQLELIPDELIVQAWRVLSWPRGVYSIARFELSDQAGTTKIEFDHTAFPKGQAEHLVSGWQEHYWDPLSKLLT
jgi:activator of HSP90 ATPase